MAVSINVRGGKQPFPSSNLEDYSVVEDATPMDPNSMSGGYGQISFDILTYPDYRLLRGKRFDLLDSVNGKTTGIVVGLNTQNESLSVTTDSMLGVLNSWHSVPAFTGTFSELVDMWFSLVGLDLPIKYEQNIGARTLVTRGFIGNLWDYIKMLLSANSIEMSVVFNTVVFRKFRQHIATTERLQSISTDINQGESARSVQIAYYSNRYVRNTEMYPPKSSYREESSNPLDEEGEELVINEPVIMQVDAGETVSYVLQLEATPVSVTRTPTPVEYVSDNVQTSSVYSVVGSDDLPVRPKQWLDGGGYLRVSISEDDPTQLEVRLRGASIPGLAPFRIAMSSGSGNYYNSLHIMGTGTVFERQIAKIYTGAERDTTGTDVGVTVENPFINTYSDALALGMHTAASYSGFQATISGEAVNINRRGQDVGVRALVRDFNETW